MEAAEEKYRTGAEVALGGKKITKYEVLEAISEEISREAETEEATEAGKEEDKEAA